MLLIFNDLGPCGSPKPIHVLIVQIVSTNYNYISRTVHNLSDIPRFLSACPRVRRGLIVLKLLVYEANHHEGA